METAGLAQELDPRYDTTESHRMHGPWLMIARVVWAVLLGVTLLVFVLAVVEHVDELITISLDDLTIESQIGIPPRLLDAYFLTLNTLSFLVFFAVAVVFFWRRSDNWLAMLISVMLATFGGLVINSTSNLLWELHPEWSLVFAMLSAIGHGTFVVFLYTFPNGRFVPRWSVWLAIGGVIWFTVASFVPEVMYDELGRPGWFVFVITFVVYSASIIIRADIVKEKHTNPTHWQQVKWIFTGLLAAFAGYLIWTLPPLIFPALSQPGVPKTVFSIASYFLMNGALTLLPVAIGFSMMRYRLWDVDFFINRGLVYGVLTAVLIVGTILDLLVLERLFFALTGEKQAPIALIGAALVSGALIQPMRRGLQSFVDKNFYGIQVAYHKKAAPALPISGDFSGAALGVYQVLEPVGRGGMAEVYKGYHPTLHRTVAIKVLLADRASRPDFRTRFEREAQAVAVLRHPNIVEIFDCGQIEGTYYMVMEYIDGISLSEHIRRNDALPLDETLTIIRGVAGALDYAHEQGLVHRDVKPSNVMLQWTTATAPDFPGYQAILTDFGIAKMLGGATALTRTGMVGTLDYIAPEQIRDAADVDGRADVYSLGVMIFEMLTGSLPFRGSNPGAVLIAHLQQPAPDPRTLRPDLPEAVAGAILRAMAKDPDARFAIAGDFVAALK
jgi:tRNA A-37 threonylcarbamoyl transferase component Bud32